jgi:protein-S-isoprenylcysteine O-methyltransferase Ste14
MLTTVRKYSVISWGDWIILFWIHHRTVSTKVAENKLVTTGVYSIVRNPVYSGFLSVCAGAVCMAANWVLFVIPVILWTSMTVVLKHSEEKCLKALYGSEYVRYCSRTNRCISWFARD